MILDKLKCLFGKHAWSTPRYGVYQYVKGHRERLLFSGFMSKCQRDHCPAEFFRFAKRKKTDHHPRVVAAPH